MNKSQRAAVLDQLANYIDLLRIGIEAGWSFDQSVIYLIEQVPGPISESFRNTYKSINAGTRGRENALQHLALTCGISELSRLLNTVLSAEQTGGNLSQILALQADDLRLELKHERERRVKRTPMKMTFVTVVLIFPAILCTLLAPAAASVFHTLLNLG